MLDNMIDDMLQSATSPSFEDNPKNFDIISDGGWFENPLGDPSTYTGLKENLGFESINPIENIDVENRNEFFYADSYGSNSFDKSKAVPIQDVHEYEISMEETSTPDGCKNLKIAALVIGILVGFLAVWLIVSAYLNTNKVICDKTTPFCPPCPVCPSSYNQDIINNTQQFYIRDRVSHHSIFNLSGEYIKNFKGENGLRFSYNKQQKTLFTEPDNFYIYVSNEGGYLKINPNKNEINWTENTCYFDLEGKELTVIFPDEDRKLYVIAHQNFLIAVEENIYIEVPYHQKIAMFKHNPNILQGI